MTNIVFVGDLVEQNGKTWKENNLEIQHAIPLGTIVEISYEAYPDEEDNTNGLRLFVVNHSRDCDGTPLYDLSFDKNIYKEYDKLDKKIKNRDFEDAMDESITKAFYWQTNGKILRHYGEESLKVV